MMHFNYNDGGRKAAGFSGTTGDCACRAIAIATGLSYKYVYNLIIEYGSREKRSNKSHPRTGVNKDTFRKLMDDLGWVWIPTMGIGTGCTTHLTLGETPQGTVICAVSKHYTTVVNGIINDTYDPSRNGTRCVYGYFIKGKNGTN